MIRDQGQGLNRTVRGNGKDLRGGAKKPFLGTMNVIIKKVNFAQQVLSISARQGGAGIPDANTDMTRIT